MPAASLPMRIFGNQAQGLREASPLAQQPRLLGSKTPKSPTSPKSPCFFSDSKAQGSPLAGVAAKFASFLTVPTDAAASQAGVAASPKSAVECGGAGQKPSTILGRGPAAPVDVSMSSADSEAMPASSPGVDRGGLPTLLGREQEAEGSKDTGAGEPGTSNSDAPSVAAYQAFLARRERIGSRRFRALGA
mmetsp:Transcript_54527/g.157665  ORF Transcript_54527/g.157665 Transcript_54527/m.157665 type:complete len:190 (-) Transcript_54527:244-813(-)